METDLSRTPRGNKKPESKALGEGTEGWKEPDCGIGIIEGEKNQPRSLGASAGLATQKRKSKKGTG